MTEDGVMVLANGMVMTREDVVASLAEAPTWDDYSIDDVRVVGVGDGAASLVYRGTARREGAGPLHRGDDEHVRAHSGRAGGWRSTPRRPADPGRTRDRPAPCG